MHVPHGDMANHKESFATIYELPQEAKTMRPSQNRPQQARAMTELDILPEEPSQTFPAQENLKHVVPGTQPVPPAEPAARPVKVSVAHGNLSFCQNPVAVGHYEGDGIFNAEKALDYHLNGRLSTRHRMGRYPGLEGTAEVLLDQGSPKAGGAIIVGLGKAGELSPRKLTQCFANAMREYGIMAAEQKIQDSDGELAVSTLLIGAGGMGLSIANSVDAILSGVLQANKSFAQEEGDLQKVRIAEVQFIELFKDQAILAARALKAYEDKPAEFAVEPRRLHSLRGGAQRLFYEEPPGWWSRIYVRAGSDDSLIFMLPSDRARAEESQQGMQKSSIDALVRQAVRSPNWDQSLASSMFELMIPNRLKGSFRDLSNVLLVLDPPAAHYPWELIYDRRAGQDKPLVIRVGLIRQFSTGTFQERVVDVKNKNVLVVGNPADTASFADLPGAKKEASLVVEKFKEADYNVVAEIKTGSNSIMNSLFAQDYRILHLAGHGVHRRSIRRAENEAAKTYTGMLLGNNIFLTANEIRNKIDIPELVFINCCHLGTLDPPERATAPESPEQASNPTQELATSESAELAANLTQELATPEYNELAASLSQELIEMGVKAVIAAGWAVDDDAALTFADVFYDQLLGGAMFGDAVKAARIKTYNRHKDRTNTWAAYQCYGDPAYRLLVKKDGGARSSDKFVDIEEAVVEIRRLSGSAKTASAERIASLREGLLNLHKKINNEWPDWLKDSGLQEALGEAFGEVYLFDQAIENYQLALDNKKCAASIKAVEQLANIRTRMAVQIFDTNPNHYEEARSIIEAQIERLTSLMEVISQNSERWSLVGSSYKRLAQISGSRSPEAADFALQKMEEAYEQAGGPEKDSLYPLTNLLAARLLRLLRTNDPDVIKKALPELKSLAEKAIKMAETEKRKSSDDFWASIGNADAILIGLLVKYLESRWKKLREEQFDELAQDYKSTWRRYGSARELNSVIDQYALLAAALGGIDAHKKLAVQLGKILESLKSIAEQ